MAYDGIRVQLEPTGDARASMIEDGCNEMLAIQGGSFLADPSRL